MDKVWFNEEKSEKLAKLQQKSKIKKFQSQILSLYSFEQDVNIMFIIDEHLNTCSCSKKFSQEICEHILAVKIAIKGNKIETIHSTHEEIVKIFFNFI